MVWVPGWISHLELSWHNPINRALFEGYAQDYTVVRYDKRGTGLSDREHASQSLYSLDARVRDLEAVVDDLKLRRFILRGTSEGGPVAIAYAARYPRKVSHLILFGTFASGSALAAIQSDVGGALMSLIRAEWGLGSTTMASLLNPGAPAPDAEDYARMQRESATAEYAAGMINALRKIEVTDLLSKIAARTLVMHAKDDKAIPFEMGRQLAAGIRNARLHAFDGGHFPSNPAVITEVTSVVRTFLTGEEQSEGQPAPQAAATRPSPAGLVTILFTDLASSTALTQRLGDAQAQELVRAHNTIVREALGAQGGSEIKHTGDGIMASFPTASAALECAIAIQRAVEARGDSNLSVHIGVNAGEPVAEDADLFGTSVQLARRICDHARSGEILASNVVRELSAGKGFLFADIGEVVPKGFEEPVRLHEVRWRE